MRLTWLLIGAMVAILSGCSAVTPTATRDVAPTTAPTPIAPISTRINSSPAHTQTPGPVESTPTPEKSALSTLQNIFPATGVIEFCGIPNFAWTIGNRLARSAQPTHEALACLRDAGFTTILRQNIEGDDSWERREVERLGMRYLSQYQITDDTAYSPDMLETKMADVVDRLGDGETILVHDAGGRGRMGFWEATFLMWDGWSSQEAIDRYVEFGWKIDCENGGNGQMQGINEIAVHLGQPAYYPDEDTYGSTWPGCPRPDYMDGWDYRSIQWPPGGGRLLSK